MSFSCGFQSLTYSLSSWPIAHAPSFVICTRSIRVSASGTTFFSREQHRRGERAIAILLRAHHLHRLDDGILPVPDVDVADRLDDRASNRDAAACASCALSPTKIFERSGAPGERALVADHHAVRQAGERLAIEDERRRLRVVDVDERDERILLLGESAPIRAAQRRDRRARIVPREPRVVGARVVERAALPVRRRLRRTSRCRRGPLADTV